MKQGFYLLALYILLRGSDSTLLKTLQQAGNLTEAAGGPQVISFCNVFFFSSLICGLAMVIHDRSALKRNLPLIKGKAKFYLALQGFSGFFLGPVAFFLALDHLSVVEQTLLFSLTIPLTALAAQWCLKESLPRSFPITCALIIGGLLLCSKGSSPSQALAGIDGLGVFWALVGVAAFTSSGVLARINGQRGWGVGITVGINSLAASLVFGLLALILFGPRHFFYLSFWWVAGVIAGYATVITLGSQWSLMQAYTKLGVVPVTLWASMTIVVALTEAHLVLHEPFSLPVAIGAGMILVAVALHQLTQQNTAPLIEKL